jgi:hypothetical protein
MTVPKPTPQPAIIAQQRLTSLVDHRATRQPVNVADRSDNLAADAHACICVLSCFDRCIWSSKRGDAKWTRLDAWKVRDPVPPLAEAIVAPSHMLSSCDRAYCEWHRALRARQCCIFTITRTPRRAGGMQSLSLQHRAQKAQFCQPQSLLSSADAGRVGLARQFSRRAPPLSPPPRPSTVLRGQSSPFLLPNDGWPVWQHVRLCSFRWSVQAARARRASTAAASSRYTRALLEPFVPYVVVQEDDG